MKCFGFCWLEWLATHLLLLLFFGTASSRLHCWSCSNILLYKKEDWGGGYYGLSTAKGQWYEEEDASWSEAPYSLAARVQERDLDSLAKGVLGYRPTDNISTVLSENPSETTNLQSKYPTNLILWYGPGFGRTVFLPRAQSEDYCAGPTIPLHSGKVKTI